MIPRCPVMARESKEKAARKSKHQSALEFNLRSYEKKFSYVEQTLNNICTAPYKNESCKL